MISLSRFFGAPSPYKGKGGLASMKRALTSPCLFAGSFDLSRGLRIRNRSGWNTKFGKDKDLEDNPDCNNPDPDKNVAHYYAFSFFSALSDFSVLAAFPFGFLIAS